MSSKHTNEEFNKIVSTLGIDPELKKLENEFHKQETMREEINNSEHFLTLTMDNDPITGRQSWKLMSKASSEDTKRLLEEMIKNWDNG